MTQAVPAKPDLFVDLSQKLVMCCKCPDCQWAQIESKSTPAAPLARRITPESLHEPHILLNLATLCSNPTPKCLILQTEAYLKA